MFLGLVRFGFILSSLGFGSKESVVQNVIEGKSESRKKIHDYCYPEIVKVP